MPRYVAADRPGHHLDPVHPVRPERAARVGGPGRAPAALPAARLGRARRRGDLAQRQPGGAGGARAGRRRPASSSPRSASPTSARPPCCGTARPAVRSATPSSGRTPAPADLVAASSAGDEGPDRFRERCGLPLAPYFAGPRLAWLLDHTPGLRARAERGEVLFGTMETWLIWNLTGGPDGGVHVTDVTNASRTMLMDIAHAALGRRAARGDGRPAGGAAGDPLLQRGLRHRRPRCCRARRSPPRSATSRRRCSARPASPPARRSARTAPAASCCSTPAPRSSAPSTAAHHGRLPARRRAGARTRSRARSRSPARSCSGSATASA